MRTNAVPKLNAAFVKLSRVVVIATLPIIALASFQNCSQSLAIERQATVSMPNTLSLVHSPNHSSFQVSWLGGNHVGSCFVRYQDASGAFVDDPNLFDCDQDVVGQTITLPTPPWNGPGVTQVYLVSQTSDEVIDAFPQPLTCGILPGSSSSTPTIDEDCNGNWNNTQSSSHGGCDPGKNCYMVSYFDQDATCGGHSADYVAPSAISACGTADFEQPGPCSFRGRVGYYGIVTPADQSKCVITQTIYF